ncbi:MAG: alpha/beta hydrolase [Sulfuriferula sp.]
MTLSAPLEFIAGQQPVQASVIWLHGLGADGHDFLPVVQMLDLPGVRFILPHAPQRPVSVNGGYVMPAWYDIRGSGLDADEDASGLAQSGRIVDALITQEASRGIALSKIIVAGFSQGGALALHTGLVRKQALGGVMVLSAYLPLMAEFKERCATGIQAIPVFMAHGTQDGVVPLPLAERSRDELDACGFDVEWQLYPMAHSVCDDEIKAIHAWLMRVLKLRA